MEFNTAAQVVSTLTLPTLISFLLPRVCQCSNRVTPIKQLSFAKHWRRLQELCARENQSDGSTTNVQSKPSRKKSRAGLHSAGRGSSALTLSLLRFQVGSSWRHTLNRRPEGEGRHWHTWGLVAICALPHAPLPPASSELLVHHKGGSCSIRVEQVEQGGRESEQPLQAGWGKSLIWEACTAPTSSWFVLFNQTNLTYCWN